MLNNKAAKPYQLISLYHKIAKKANNASFKHLNIKHIQRTVLKFPTIQCHQDHHSSLQELIKRIRGGESKASAREFTTTKASNDQISLFWAVFFLANYINFIIRAMRSFVSNTYCFG